MNISNEVMHILTILAVSDLTVSKRFYDTAFNWTKEVETPVYIEYILPGGMRLGLYQRDGFIKNTIIEAQKPIDGSTTSTELYFYCNNILESIDLIEEAGAKLLSPLEQRDWGDEAAYFSDPDNNVIVLASQNETPK